MTQSQSAADTLVGNFCEQASDWRSLVSMAVGGLGYRWGRVGVLSAVSRLSPSLHKIPFFVQGTSALFGLGTEVTAFEFTNRFLHTIRATGQSPLQNQSHNLWSWSGQGGWKEGWLSSFFTFGTLKAFGKIAEGENLLVQQGAQDFGMVLGHHLLFHTGLGEKPEGTLADQLFQAEVTNLQMAAGISLGHALTGGRLQALERSLDLSFHSQGRFLSKRIQNNPEFAFLSSAVIPKERSPNLASDRLFMSSKDGSGGGRPPKAPEPWKSKGDWVAVQALEKTAKRDLQAVEHLIHLSESGNEDATKALLRLNVITLFSKMFGEKNEIHDQILEALKKAGGPFSGHFILFLDTAAGRFKERLSEEGKAIYGIPIPKGSAYRIFEEDLVAGVSLSSETEIHGTLFPKDSEIEITPQGRVQQAILKSPAILRGIPCTDSEFILLHENGNIKRAVLSHPHLIEEIVFPSGTSVEFDENGKLIRPEETDPKSGPKGSGPGPAALAFAGIGTGLATLLAADQAQAAVDAISPSASHGGLTGFLLSLSLGLGALAMAAKKGGSEPPKSPQNPPVLENSQKPPSILSRYVGVTKELVELGSIESGRFGSVGITLSVLSTPSPISGPVPSTLAHRLLQSFKTLLVGGEDRENLKDPPRGRLAEDLLESDKRALLLASLDGANDPRLVVTMRADRTLLQVEVYDGEQLKRLFRDDGFLEFIEEEPPPSTQPSAKLSTGSEEDSKPPHK